MFNKDDEKIANENIILKGRPNLFLSCKKVFVLLVLLGAISYLSPLALDYIVQIQGQLVNIVTLPIVQIATWIVFIIIFSIIIWIIWTLVSWTAKEYIIFDNRITYKTGILFRKTIHMPYSKIQDVVVSQGILERLVSVGTVTAYSGYDGSKLELKNVSKPNKIEETIFEEIHKLNSPYPNQSFMNQNGFVNGPNSYSPQEEDFDRYNNYNNQYNQHNLNDYNNNINPNNQRYQNNYNNPNHNNYNDPNNYRNPDNQYNRNYNESYDENYNNGYGAYENNQDSNNSYNNEGQYQSNRINQNNNSNHKIRDNYSSHEEDPKKIYGPITKDDFPFLKKDNNGYTQDNGHNNRHNVSDFVENPENYQNSSTFFDNALDETEKEESNVNEYKSDDHVDSDNINQVNNIDHDVDDYVNNYHDYTDNGYTDDGYVDDNDYFDKTMDQAINKLNGDLKFNNNNNNDKVDDLSDFHNKNPEQNHNLNQDQYQNPNNNQRHNLDNNQNNNSNKYQNNNHNNYNNYNNHNINQNNQNSNQNSNPNSNPNNYQDNYQNRDNFNNQDNYMNGNQNQYDNYNNSNYSNYNNESKNSEDKSKDVLERHFRKFRK